MSEKFSHCHRRGSHSSNLAKPFNLLRRKHVFEEEEPIRLQPLGKLDCHVRIQVLVHIMQELKIPPEPIAEMLEHLRDGPGVQVLVEPGARIPSLHTLALSRSFKASATVAPHLGSHITESLLHVSPNTVFHCF
jgi:hypothetical protein